MKRRRTARRQGEEVGEIVAQGCALLLWQVRWIWKARQDVYVLGIFEWYEGGHPIGVYSSRAKAIAAAEAWIRQHRNKDVRWPGEENTMDLPGERVSMGIDRLGLDEPALFKSI